MKYNPIINGIPEGKDRQVDNCETTMKNCINKDLGVEGYIECHNVHRLRLSTGNREILWPNLQNILIMIRFVHLHLKFSNISPKSMQEIIPQM